MKAEGHINSYLCYETIYKAIVCGLAEAHTIAFFVSHKISDRVKKRLIIIISVFFQPIFIVNWKVRLGISSFFYLDKLVILMM
ncbi:hypothetical protein SMU70_01986 [Streptococcus mutans NLML5]|nr:hypothetical protein SMU70_01986 [Streptococcus mutans NLML5]